MVDSRSVRVQLQEAERSLAKHQAYRTTARSAAERAVYQRAIERLDSFIKKEATRRFTQNARY